MTLLVHLFQKRNLYLNDWGMSFFETFIFKSSLSCSKIGLSLQNLLSMFTGSKMMISQE